MCTDQAWELSVKTQISVAVKLTVHIEKNCLRKRSQWYKKQTGSTDFSSAPNTRKTIEAQLRSVIAHFCRLIVNTVIPTRLFSMFD